MATQLTDTERIAQLEQQLQAVLAQVAQAATPPPAAMPRLKHPKPDYFHGGTSEPTALHWCDQVDTYLVAMGHAHSLEGAANASAYLKGAAATWFSHIKKEATKPGSSVQPIANWADLRARILAEFQVPNHRRIAMDKMAALQQVKSVRIYTQRFRELHLELGDAITEESALHSYLSGLKRDVAIAVKLQQPANLPLAMSLAEEADSTIWQTDSKGKATATRPRPNASAEYSRRNGHQQARNGPTPMDIGAVSAVTVSDAEKAQLLADGRCFVCKRRGHRARFCPTKSSQHRSAPRAAAAQEN